MGENRSQSRVHAHWKPRISLSPHFLLPRIPLNATGSPSSPQHSSNQAKLRQPNTGTPQDLAEPLDIVKFTEAVRGIGGMLESLAQ